MMRRIAILDEQERWNVEISNRNLAMSALPSGGRSIMTTCYVNLCGCTRRAAPSGRMAALLLVASLFTLALPAHAVTVNIVSDTRWTVSDTNGRPLGNAQNVCLNATTSPPVPSNCPAGATSYGYTRVGWTANLSSIP